MKSKLILVTAIVLSVFLALVVALAQGTSGYDGYTRNGLQTLNNGEPNKPAAKTYLGLDYVIDVRDKGAVIDDATNDLTAINNAITAAVVAGGSQTVWLPAGNYFIGNGANGIQLTNPNITLRGEGATATILRYTGVGAALSITNKNCEIRGIGFDLDSTGATGISVGSPGWYVRLYDVTVADAATVGLSLLNDSYWGHFEKVNVQTSVKGVSVASGANAHTFLNCQFQGAAINNGYGIYLDGGTGCTWIGCDVSYYSTGTGYGIYATANAGVHTFLGGFIEGNDYWLYSRCRTLQMLNITVDNSPWDVTEDCRPKFHSSPVTTTGSYEIDSPLPNLAYNGDFEFWNGAVPIGWDATYIAVAQETTITKSGGTACKLTANGAAEEFTQTIDANCYADVARYGASLRCFVRSEAANDGVWTVGWYENVAGWAPTTTLTNDGTWQEVTFWITPPAAVSTTLAVGVRKISGDAGADDILYLDRVQVTLGRFTGNYTESGNYRMAEDGVIGTSQGAAQIRFDGSAGQLGVTGIIIANAGIMAKNGATSAGYLDLYENSGAGTNKVRLAGQTLAADANSFCVYTKQVDLTNANIKALAAGVELVAAPGAGRWLELVSASLWLDYGSEVLAEPSTPDDLAIEYDTGTGPAASAAIVASGFITAAADTMAFAVPVSIAGTAATSIVNKNLAIVNLGSDYTGNASNDTTMRIILNYRIHDALGL